MLFSNRLKGNITQSLVRALLQDGGYRIVPLGIEEVVREVAVLPQDQYTALGLPNVLRSMPDFFVSQADMQSCWLVEVKYRKTWNDATRKTLGDQIKPQVEAWGLVYLIVFLGSSAKKDTSLPSSWFGVHKLAIREGELWTLQKDGTPYKKWDELLWQHFYRVQDFFPALSGKPQFEQQTLQQVRSILPQLADLNVFE